MTDFAGRRVYLFRGRSQTITVAGDGVAARLDALDPAVIPTGMCLTCQFRVPVLRTGVPAVHWPHGGFAPRLARLRPRCPGRSAGLIMITSF